MGFGQNVLRMTWKERFVQFSCKAHCFPVSKTISGHCDDFENLNAQNCELAKTCCAWPEKSVLYNFQGKRTAFRFRREFQASVTILRTFTLKIAIWPKRAAHDLKRAFCTFFIKSARFSLFGENFRPVWRFWELWRPKCDLDKTCCAWPEKSVLYNFYKKRTVFPFWTSLRPVSRFWELWRSQMGFGQNVLRMTWKERFVQFSCKAHCFPVSKTISGHCDDFENFNAQNCELAKTCCAWPEKSVLYNFQGKRTAFRFRREFQASVTILRTFTLKIAIWPKRAAHDLKRAFCTIFIKRALFTLFEENLRPVWRFWELSCSEMRFGQNVLRMTWKERFVQFWWKAHCFLVSKRISGQCDDFENFDAQNAIWPKLAAHDLKRAFCTIFIKSALFFLFGENFRPVGRFWELWHSKMRFGQNVLRVTWKERFVQFSWKAHCFPVLNRISRQFHDFENLDARKCDLAKTYSAWPETSVLYSFHRKRTVFPFWREFQASVTILKTLTLKNAIWPKRAAHDLKTAFCTIFMESALFCRFEENLRPVSRFLELWRSEIRFDKNLLRMTWKERFVQFL